MKICANGAMAQPGLNTAQHIFSWRNKNDISIFQMKKSALSVAMLQVDSSKYLQHIFHGDFFLSRYVLL